MYRYSIEGRMMFTNSAAHLINNVYRQTFASLGNSQPCVLFVSALLNTILNVTSQTVSPLLT